MVAALKPLHEKSIINRVVVSTYQAVSGAGKTAMDELFNQTQNVYANQELKKEKFTKQIAFNAIPHIGLFSPGGKISAEYAPKAAKKGCIVIDNTSHFRMQQNIPLIVPEVNANALDEFFDDENRTNIISNPNCSTIQMVVALKPLHEKAIINRVVVSTYQAVSGAGKTGMDELFNQTQNVYANQELKKEKFTKQIAFNAIPHIGAFLENGNTEEEQKMIDETKKILDDGINVSATCVRTCLLYTSPSPRDKRQSRMPSSA